jgi:hypothetical protein
MQFVKSPEAVRLPIEILLGLIGLAALATAMYADPTVSVLVLVLMIGTVGGTLLLWRAPEMGLLIVSFLGADIIPREQLVVSLGGFHLDPADITLVGVLALVIAKGIRQGTLIIPRWTMIGPLVAFAGFALFSAAYAMIGQGVSVTFVAGELRPAIYCAGCAIAAATLTRRQQLTRLLIGFFVIADITAAMIFYDQLGRADFNLTTTPLPGSWQISLIGSGFGGFGSVRVVPAGHVLLYLMANIAFALLLRPPKVPLARVFFAAHFLLLGASLALTYTRAQWIASALAMLLIVALVPRAIQLRLAGIVGIGVPIIAVASWLVVGDVVPVASAGALQALSSRISTIVQPTDTLTTDSIEWRAFEVDQATAAIAEHPILGVGLGNDYRPITLLQGEANGVRWQLGGPGRLTRWVHASYLYVAVKMGLLALGVFGWFALAFLISGTRLCLNMTDSAAKLVVLAVVASFAGFLVWVVFEAHLMLPGSMVTLGIMVGIVAALGTIYPNWKTVVHPASRNSSIGSAQ